MSVIVIYEYVSVVLWVEMLCPLVVWFCVLSFSLGVCWWVGVASRLTKLIFGVSVSSVVGF